MTADHHDIDDHTPHRGPRLALLDDTGRVLAVSPPLRELPEHDAATLLRVRATVRPDDSRTADPRLVTARPRAPLGV